MSVCEEVTRCIEEYTSRGHKKIYTAHVMYLCHTRGLILCIQMPNNVWVMGIIGASEVKPLSSGWCKSEVLEMLCPYHI